jgi:hypothetical protein
MDPINLVKLSPEALITGLLTMVNQYKILHWQTTSFSQHKAFDGIFGDLNDLVDDFVEVYMGKYGRVFAAGSFGVTMENYAKVNCIALTDSYIKFLTEKLPTAVSPKDTDMLNIRDEMLGKLNQLKYLLTLA